MAFKVGDVVVWKWLGREIRGSVEEVHKDKITKKIKGKKITRNGSDDNPAYLVKSDAGNLALKLGTELKKIEVRNGPQPKMFSDN